MKRTSGYRWAVWGLVLTAVICVGWLIVQSCCSPAGTHAEVRVNGQAVLQLDLRESSRHWIDGDRNIRLCVVCGAGGVYVEHSDCPDKICVNKGRITAVGDTIVCLPAKTVIEIMP